MNIFEGLQAAANVHPLFVHFPIALLMMAGVLFIACYFMELPELRIAAKWNLILGSLSAAAAVITGFIAANTLPHNQEIHEAMLMHRNIMVPATLLSLALGGYLFFKKDPSLINKQKVFLAVLILTLGLLAVGADYGGKMVFKYGAGTELFKKTNQEEGAWHKHVH